MSILHVFLPPYPVWWPTLFAILFYSFCFVVFAGSAYFVSGALQGHPTGVTEGRVRQIWREMMYSVLTILVFGFVNALLFGYGLIRPSLLYYKLSSHSIWWFWLSIPLMLLLHDTFFYWLHRAMHSRLLFNCMHRVHHQSVYPTAFAAYNFHPLEALAHALIVTVIIYIIPVHTVAFLIFQAISTAYNAYGHCGCEFYNKAVMSHWLGRWLNTSTLHGQHHLKGDSSYGLYFTFWDHAMKTIESKRYNREDMAEG